MKTRVLERPCPVCGTNGMVVYEEPENDSSGKNTKWINASGCWVISDDGKKISSRCETLNA